jgi:hypothetical protein
MRAAVRSVVVVGAAALVVQACGAAGGLPERHPLVLILAPGAYTPSGFSST